MTKFQLITQLQLAFLQYNENAMQTGQKSFFVREANGVVVVYTVPKTREYDIPSEFFQLIREIKRYDGLNCYFSNTIFDIVKIDIQIRNEGLSECD